MMKKFYGSLLGKLVVCGMASLSVLANGNATESSVAVAGRIDISKIYQALQDRGVYTMVPRSSVLHVPKGMECKLGNPVSGDELVNLDKFMRKNCVWVHKFPVTLYEAQGKVPIDPVRLERVSKLGKVVIAVHKGKVISVKPQPVAELAKVE
jgi:hypothetical protein